MGLKNGKPTPTLEEQLAEDKKKRVTTCTAEINALLKKHKCTLQPFATLTNGQPARLGVNIVSE
jgi:hypothetical protein